VLLDPKLAVLEDRAAHAESSVGRNFILEHQPHSTTVLGPERIDEYTTLVPPRARIGKHAMRGRGILLSLGDANGAHLAGGREDNLNQARAAGLEMSLDLLPCR